MKQARWDLHVHRHVAYAQLPQDRVESLPLGLPIGVDFHGAKCACACVMQPWEDKNDNAGAAREKAKRRTTGVRQSVSAARQRLVLTSQLES